jgi:Predicted pyridoxal phosphate-dependent enzyme apparently involved in regulation of cell wall biogenesis
MRIPLIDLKAQNQTIQNALETAALNVLSSGRYCLGPEVDAFERAFARYCETDYAVAVNSGTSALHLALLACGVGRGDEVITVSFTFVATIAAILSVGAKPVLVDVEPRSWTIDPETVLAAITPRTKAIVPVHLHGRLADMAALIEIANRKGLRLIVDASQAHGARYNGRRAEALGDIGSFSFYPAKPLGALGEGGAIVTNNPTLAEHVRLLRNWGQVAQNEHAFPGFNMRMDAIQAAMLRVKLEHVDHWTAARAKHARQYRERLCDIACMPDALPGCDPVHHVFAIEIADRDRVRSALHAEDIETGIHYPHPVHLQPAYSGLGYRRGDFPVSERICSRTLSLPLFAELTAAQIDRVCDVIWRAASMSGDGHHAIAY